MAKNSDSPQLQKPGAVLPFWESFVMRWYVGPVLSKKSAAPKNTETFEKLNAKILKLVEGLSQTQLDQKILVPRLPSIEDSSRYWSISETLEHLEIVGDGIIQIIESLAEGRTVTVEINIANVKPKGAYRGQDARVPFKKFNDRILEKLNGLSISPKTPKARHPWMGNFNALQWQWVLAVHSGVHLRQIKKIIEEL